MDISGLRGPSEPVPRARRLGQYLYGGNVDEYLMIQFPYRKQFPHISQAPAEIDNAASFFGRHDEIFYQPEQGEQHVKVPATNTPVKNAVADMCIIQVTYRAICTECHKYFFEISY